MWCHANCKIASKIDACLWIPNYWHKCASSLLLLRPRQTKIRSSLKCNWPRAASVGACECSRCPCALIGPRSYMNHTKMPWKLSHLGLHGLYMLAYFFKYWMQVHYMLLTDVVPNAMLYVLNCKSTRKVKPRQCVAHSPTTSKNKDYNRRRQSLNYHDFEQS